MTDLTFYPIKGYEDSYGVNKIGQIISWEKVIDKQIRKERILRLEKTRNGYLRVMLCKECVHKKIYVHRLVAETFLPNPFNKSQINHKNLNKTDNSLDNLEWVTQEENNLHYQSIKPNNSYKYHNPRKPKILKKRHLIWFIYLNIIDIILYR